LLLSLLTGSPLGIHNFSHQLVRPPSTSTNAALPLFTVNSAHGIPAVPVVSIAVTKGLITSFLNF